MYMYMYICIYIDRFMTKWAEKMAEIEYNSVIQIVHALDILSAHFVINLSIYLCTCCTQNVTKSSPGANQTNHATIEYC